MKNNLTKNKLAIAMIGLLAMAACRREDRNFKEITGDAVTVQLTRLPEAEQQSGSGYKFRIIPSKKFIATHQLQTDNFWFHMDSCFYTEQRGIKTYLALVQPIANGTKGNFEYLLQFDPIVTAGTDQVKLIYQDRFITGKNYTFNIEL